MRRVVSASLLAALTILLIEVLLEAWVQEVLGNRYVELRHLVPVVVGDLPGWPKQLKNGLLLALIVLSVMKIAIEHRWREFTSRADIALAVVIAVMVLAGLLGTSGPVLIGEAVFVYLRGAIVFYAVRALRPTWPQVQRVLWILGGLIAVNIVVAAVQMVVGLPAFTGVGWVDLQQAEDNRSQGLLDHPNHLGQVVGLALIGVIAYLSGRSTINRWWWVAVGAGALGIASTQSRQTLLALLAAVALVWILRRAPLVRGAGRTMTAATLVIIVFFAGHVLARPGNIEELLYRLRGVATAVENQAGSEDCEGYASSAECTEDGKQQPREIRVLFFQQGARLLAERPLLGYGVGQFGGIVAEKHDPQWETDPRFGVLGADGFNLYDWDGTTVDSHWLHLVVEVGVLGLIAYLIWLWFVTAPLLRAARGSPEGDERVRWVALWGVATMLFTIIVAVFSNALDDPLYPPLAFAILGLGWALTRDVAHGPQPRPADSTGDAVGSTP